MFKLTAVVSDNAKGRCWNASLPGQPEGLFCPPTKNELFEIIRATKLSFEGQISPYGIWTGTEEMFTLYSWYFNTARNVTPVLDAEVKFGIVQNFRLQNR